MDSDSHEREENTVLAIEEELGDDLSCAITTAAERGDRLTFAALASRAGLEKAQTLVRSRGIVRMVDRVALRALPVADMREETETRDAGGAITGNTLYGHFAVFNAWTEIDSMFEGNFLERIAPGAFNKTFKEGRDRMRALFQHGYDPQIGDKPLGPIAELKSDEIGGYYEVPLLDTSYTRDLRPGLEAGLYGASFRFRMMKEDFNQAADVSDFNPRALPERTLREVQVYEFGPVTFPAYREATAQLRASDDAGEARTDEPVAEALLERAGAKPHSEIGSRAKPLADIPIYTPQKEHEPWRL